jgi:hypothetical protein
LGIGDWAQSPIPNPQSPIPNPHFYLIKLFILDIKNIKIKILIEQDYFFLEIKI